MSASASLPGLLEELAARNPRGVAIRQKRRGLWDEVTWSEYAGHVRAVALALDEMGARPRRPHCAVRRQRAPLALRRSRYPGPRGCVGGHLSGARPEAASSAIVRSGARIVFCGDQEQVDKLLERQEADPDDRAHDRVRREGPAHARVRRYAARDLRRVRRPWPCARRRVPRTVRGAPERTGPRRRGNDRPHLRNDRRATRLPAQPGRYVSTGPPGCLEYRAARARRRLLPAAARTCDGAALRRVRAARRGLDARLRGVTRDGPARPGRSGADRARRDPEALGAGAGGHRAPDRSRRAVQARLVPMGHAPAHVGRGRADRRPPRLEPGRLARPPARCGVRQAAGRARRSALPRHRRLRSWPRTRCAGSGRSASPAGSSTDRSRRAVS